MVGKLWAKRYLRNIEPDFEKLTLHREAAQGNPAEKTAIQGMLMISPLDGLT